MTRLLFALLACLLTLTACPMDTTAKKTVLPRNMALKTFDPHRPSFTCVHEADHVPPIDPEAEAWFQEGMRVTSRDLWPNQRNYPKAVELWTKAAERKHWKAMMNLAGVLIEGDGTEPYVVQPDPERAVQIVEEGMRLGIPAAYDMMGSFHQNGLGVKGDISRAYAFWEMAADMGSPQAQAYLGDKLNATYDNAQEGFWGNSKVGLQMLECSFAQGNGKAAFALSIEHEVNKDYADAIRLCQEGTKMGSEDCANSLSVIFSPGKGVSANEPPTDAARSERYNILGDALYHNPDLRFPNLDKVLPLPPARLPMWDGKKESLINAAKAVVAKPAAPVPPKPGSGPASVPPSQRTGRAHIPEGFALPERPQIEVPPQYESTRAPVAGYWIARLVRHSEERHLAWDEAQWPVRYARDELFDLDASRIGLRDDDGRILFHYLGDPVPFSAPGPRDHPLVARGIARHADLPEPPRLCKGHAACPKTGIWSASVAKDHPHAAVFNQWSRQSYVAEGEAFPDPRQLHLDIEPGAVTWRWWGQPNDIRNVFLAYIRVDEPKELAAEPAPQVQTQASADAGPETTASAATPPTPEEAPAKGAGLLGRLWPGRG